MENGKWNMVNGKAPANGSCGGPLSLRRRRKHTKAVTANVDWLFFVFFASSSPSLLPSARDRKSRPYAAASRRSW